MPELPEVETIKRGLSKLIINKQVAKVDFDTAKSFPNASADVNRFLIGSKVKAISRRGKALLVELSSGYTLIVHLRMTGQLVYNGGKVHFGAGHPSDSLINLLPDNSTRATITFTDKSKLYFNDQRKFGWMRLHPSALISDIDFFRRLGPEPLAPGFGWQQLATRLKTRPRSAVKAALLDQSVLAGVGNIYADESLWGAKIHPATIVMALSNEDFKALHTALIKVLTLSIERGGSTDRNYVDAEGKRGSYLEFASVFRRQNLPCPRCAATIIKTRVAGRGTHYCPQCQQVKQVSAA
ncbi:MAG: bifunctional DNA-formamidopyrimidine glycosylase/DNA-(apurinic or apyrimidinic site) lyase [Candidatus Saccharimonadales bacterium]